MFGQDNKQEIQRQVSRSRKKGLFTSMQSQNQYLEQSKPNPPQQEIFPNVTPYLQSTLGINQLLIPKGNYQQLRRPTNNNYDKSREQSYSVNIKYQQIHRDIPSHSVKENIHHNNLKSQFVTQPPLHFVPQYLDGNIHQVIEGNVKRTYVPHHIYNDIPVYDQPNINNTQPNGQNNDTIINHYRKLYESYSQQKINNLNLNNKITNLEAQIRNNPKQPRLTKTIDKSQLSKLIKLKYSHKVDEIMSNRKANALNRIRELFSSQNSTFREQIRSESYSYQ